VGEGACVRVTRYNIVMKTAAAMRALRNVSMLGDWQANRLPNLEWRREAGTSLSLRSEVKRC
jgi:hypothetical protein